MFRNGIIDTIIAVGGRRESEDFYGSAIVKRTLVELGVPSNIIIVDSLSYDTYTNINSLETILKHHNIAKVAIVSTPIHVYRIIEIAQNESYHPAPYYPKLKNFYDIVELVSAVNHEWTSIALTKMLGRNRYDRWIYRYRNKLFPFGFNKTIAPSGNEQRQLMDK
jgi:hypothetical protein